VEFLSSLIHIIISSANCDIVSSSLSICIHLTSFCCLIALARTSTLWNRQRESGQPGLVPAFSGDVYSFSPLTLMLATGLLYIAFIMFRCRP
jgi:hypothetical protein